MSKSLSVAVAAVTLAGFAVPAFAQSDQPAGAPAAESGADRDSSQLICQKQEITGSRLGTKRICKTRAQWADFQLQERQQVEKVQVQRGMKGQ